MDYKTDDQKTSPEEKVLACAPAMVRIYEMADRLAQSDVSVLIYGESGVGKNHLAEYIQKKGAAPHAPFVHVFCNAVSDQLFASELFGYTSNAFTGASAKGKVGLLDSAQNGTVLFDQINELSPENQALLLHFLQNKTITPIGSLKAREIHTRILAVSGRNLMEMIQEGSFRADLYYRICVASIYIPPLRERREEIPLFLSHFIRRFEEEQGWRGESHQISEDRMQKLCSLDWAGNLWEVENLALRISLAPQADQVVDDYLEQEKRCALSPSAVSSGSHQAEAVKPLKEALRDFEIQYIRHVVSQSGSLQSAARSLGIGYSTLCRKRAEYGMTEPAGRGLPPIS